ncbi:MAG: cytochrome c peroxidase [Bacteroidota bacterium]
MLVLTATACSKQAEQSAPLQPLNVSAEGPAYFPAASYRFTNNELTSAGFQLGRRLFYDELLSVENDISCASCHQQRFAFSDPSHAIPHGAHGKLGTRNSPGIFNMRWTPAMMWDGGITNLELMPVAPLTNPVEMDETLDNIVRKLNANASYREAFRGAFGSETITAPMMLKAFAQFMGAMVSADSRYDRFRQGKLSLSADEMSGMQLFDDKCGSCHSGELFTDFSFRNNGIDSAGKDDGRFLVTQQNTDRGTFRVPSLRNVAITRPYMHDGRFNSLEEVLQHYTSGIRHAENLDPVLKTGLGLSAEQSRKIISFLGTLTDETFTKDPRFSKP